MSAARTSSAVTGKGIEWIVSPSTVAASATARSSFRSSGVSPISVRVFGRPTFVVNTMKSSISWAGAPSRTSWAREPMLTFCPWVSPCVCGAAVSPLWIACAAARPPDSKPSPDSSVFASTTASRAGVTTRAATASSAGSAFSHRMLQLSSASAVPARVGRPPAIAVAVPRRVARASSQVASASPIPAARKRAGASATTWVSMRTRSGLRGKKRYSWNSPSAV